MSPSGTAEGRRRFIDSPTVGTLEPGDPAIAGARVKAATRGSPFLGDELSAGSLGCGDDLLEALITAQRIPARIEAEIAVCWASRDRWGGKV
jgi:hypothetical protein